MIIRGGIPKPIHATAPAVPGAPVADLNALLPFQFLAEQKTVWIRIDNTGGNPLRLFPRRPDLDPSKWLDYYEIAAGGFLEGMFEFTDLWLAGSGGTTTFKALFGLRVL